MLDFYERIAGCSIFSKVDLWKSYPDTDASGRYREDSHRQSLRAIRDPADDLWPDTGNTFQLQMDRLPAGLDFVFVYLDDIIIGSRSASEHLWHLRALFQRLQTAGLVINQEKCVLGVTEVEFLGHHVTAASVSPIASRVAAIQQHPETATVKELQGFLGVINFYEGRDKS
jgi:hypothetical protein